MWFILLIQFRKMETHPILARGFRGGISHRRTGVFPDRLHVEFVWLVLTIHAAVW